VYHEKASPTRRINEWIHEKTFAKKIKKDGKILLTSWRCGVIIIKLIENSNKMREWWNWQTR